VDTIRMHLGGAGEKLGLERSGIQPRSARFVEQGEGVGHALKLSPHEQLVAALGFVTLKPPSVSAST